MDQVLFDAGLPVLNTAPHKKTAAAKPAKRRPLSTRKKLLFSMVITLMFLGLLEVGLAFFGWKPAADQADPYVGFAGHVPLFTQTIGRLNQAEMATAPNKLRWFNVQSFPVHKGPKTFRIFTLGGSTTYGHPYNDATSFSGWLRELLPEADSETSYEVINCGGISYASYRVANLMEELLQYEPDLFIVYSGHNEFLEARTYTQLRQTPSLILKLGQLASHTRTFTAMQSLTNPQSRADRSTDDSKRKPGNAGPSQLSSEVNTLLDSAVGPEVYHRDDPQRAKICEHYAYNLRRMVTRARQSGAEVILVTPAANIGQCSPFKSENNANLMGAKLLEWQAAYEKSLALFREGKFAEAMYPINLAVELNGRHADTLYLRAQILQALDEHERARQDYLKARDEDVCTLRAPSEIIESVRKVASEMQVPIVDFVDWTEQHSPHRITNDALFLDHVHGTIEAYKELAILLVDQMAKENMGGVRPASSQSDGRVLTADQIAKVTQRVMGTIDTQAHGAALRNVSKVYSWAGKKEDADRIALRALELVPDDAETVYQAANAYVRMQQVDKGIELYHRVLQLESTYATTVYASLGFAHALKGEEEKCIEYYQRALELNPKFADIHYNLATILEKRQRLAEAESHYLQAIGVNDHHYQAQYRLGLVYALQEKWEAARKQFKVASKLNPAALEPHLGLAQVFSIQGEKAAAIDEYKWVLQRAPNHVEADVQLRKLLQ